MINRKIVIGMMSLAMIAGSVGYPAAIETVHAETAEIGRAHV